MIIIINNECEVEILFTNSTQYFLVYVEKTVVEVLEV